MKNLETFSKGTGNGSYKVSSKITQRDMNDIRNYDVLVHNSERNLNFALEDYMQLSDYKATD